jgi:hypothetical protein
MELQKGLPFTMLILTTSNDDNGNDNMLSVPPIPSMMYQKKGEGASS